VSRFWLKYKSRNRLTGVVILDASSIISACRHAGRTGLNRGADLVEVHELDPATAKLVPATAIGRMLKLDEAAKLLRKIERGIPRRPPAPSVKGRRAARKRA
jgi:hypothetical protein